MSRITCPCLNINVYAATIDWRRYSVPANRLFSQEDIVVGKDNVLYEINLDVAGIIVEVNALTLSRHVGDWIIYSCSNCQTDVYISHAIKEGRTFITSGLVSGHEAIQKMCQLENFSTVFKILLNPVEEEDDDKLRRKRVYSMSFGHEDPDMKSAHQQMKTYLKKEEEVMEERIKSFEEKQRKMFSELQERAHYERRLLFAAIAKAREKVISEEIKSASTETKTEIDTETNSESSREAGKVIDAEVVDIEKGVENQATQKVTITIKDGSLYSTSQLQSEQEDSLFALEGFDDGQMYEEDLNEEDVGDIAFPQSDDEEISTSDSSFRDISALNGMNLATSVPVDIPLFQTSTTNTTSNEDDSNVGDVGNSIRQLALSVQDTGMFGDLPRPRIMANSTTINWH